MTIELPFRLYRQTVLITVFLMSLVFLIAEIINDRFWLPDFEVYYKAAERLLSGITLYRHPEDLHYIYKYSPVCAVFFVPFSLIPFYAAKIIFWFFLTGVIAYGFIACAELSTYSQIRSEKSVSIAILIAIFCLALHFLRELHLGQVNQLLFAGYLIMARSYLLNKEKTVSVFFALTFFIKPFALIFIPLFIFRKQYRLILKIIISIVVLSFTPLLFNTSIEHFISEYFNWFHELRVEMSHKQGLFTAGNLTIFSIAARYTPLGFLITNGINIPAFQLLTLTIIAGCYYWFIKNEKPPVHGTIADFGLLIATIPLLAYTSENAFGFAELTVVLILMNWQRITLPFRILAITGLVLLGGNFAEVIGRKLSVIADNLSLVSIGTIFLIAVLFRLRYKQIV
ncbi:MAG TPA: glycosyltransferase family 87 protein [Bacteroidia bacterium]|nr:glycosyltransferase family 87 protein [Bacteroidia bacterium]